MKPQPKSNLVHQLLLAGLLANKTATRTEARGKTVRDKSGKNAKWVETEVEVAIPTLAGNVSDANVERAARRWAA